MSSTTLIIGGHGKVALLLAPLLTQRGHEVRSAIRSEDQSEEVGATGATAVLADVETMGTEELAALMEGVDNVVWSAGAGGGDPDRTYAVDRDAAIRSIDAAEAAGVRRYVMVSYHHGVPQDNPFFHYAEAKAAADEHLRRSDLAWTILGPSALTMELATGSIEVAPEGDGSVAAGEVSRADVAGVVAEVLEREDTVGRTIRFNDGEVPIAVALAAQDG